MKFFVDAQLPPALCRWLREHGQDALHVSDVGLLAATDAEIADYVVTAGLALITKDEDFVVLRLPDRFALVWFRCGNATNAALIRWIVPRWNPIIELLEAGERLVEVR